MITANSVSELSPAALELLERELPQNDSTFDFELVKQLDKLEFFADSELVGALIYAIYTVKEKKLFFISAFALDAKKAGVVGGDVYLWVEDKARELGCAEIVFDSPRKGMLKHSITYGWDVVNVRYRKVL